MKQLSSVLLFTGISLNVQNLSAQPEKLSAAELNLIVNGGFESGAPSDFGTLKNWDVFGNIGSLPIGFTKTKIGFAPSYVPREGMRMAIFSAGNNDFSGAISQVIDTVPGVTYFVKLAMGVTSEAMGRKQVLQVAVADGDGALILTRIETIVSLGKGTTWKEFSANFVATGRRSRISLQDYSKILPMIETSNTDLIIDDVAIARKNEIHAISRAEN